MPKLKKNRMTAILEQLLPVVLAVVCVLVMISNTHTASLAIPLPLNFEGAYSVDGGESWQVLTDASELSTSCDDLLLRGHFDEDIYPGGVLYLYRDHLAIDLTVNGEPYYESVQSQILALGEAGKPYFADNCGREWVMIGLENGLLHTDTVEIRLQKMHGHIPRGAYRSFLDSCYVGPIDTMIVEAHLQPHVTHWLIFSGFLLLIAVMMLGAALAAATFRMNIVGSISKLGLLLLFSGGYLTMDTVTLTFWNETLVFNTYAWQLCMMLAVYWMGLVLRDLLTGQRHKIAKIVMILSLALNVALIVPSFTGAWAIYDTIPAWFMGQIIFGAALLGAALWELCKGPGKDRLSLCSGVLLLIALFLDMAAVADSMYSHGTCTKLVFGLVFVVHGFRGLKRVLVDYQGAYRAKKLEKELEDSRIAIMLSQMQPHFIHNILNVIYYMCGKDPNAARDAISKFSDHLRNNLEALSQHELITFRKELDHIRTYLELERIRFGEELSVIYDIEEDSFLLPVLTVQPLVENAVKHGIAKKRGGGVVTIASRQTENGYQIQITDTGAGFDTEHYMDDGKVHVGLMNVRQRLASQMNATVEIDSVPGSGTTVTVSIPRERVYQ